MDIDIDDIPESLSEKTEPKAPSVNISLLQSMLQPRTVEIRAEVAHSSAINFLNLLRHEFPDENEYRRLMMNFLRSIKDNDFKKFRRVLQRAERDRKSGGLDKNPVPESK